MAGGADEASHACLSPFYCRVYALGFYPAKIAPYCKREEENRTLFFSVLAEDTCRSPLDLTGPASQVAERWRKWKRAFEYYAEGKGIENVRKKTSQLLHFAGMEVQDIFEDLQDPGPIPEEGDNAYKIAIRKLDLYFRVEGNIPY
jgi:hypothetical protein